MYYANGNLRQFLQKKRIEGWDSELNCEDLLQHLVTSTLQGLSFLENLSVSWFKDNQQHAYYTNLLYSWDHKWM